MRKDSSPGTGGTVVQRTVGLGIQGPAMRRAIRRRSSADPAGELQVLCGPAEAAAKADALDVTGKTVGAALMGWYHSILLRDGIFPVSQGSLSSVSYHSAATGARENFVLQNGGNKEER